MEKNNDFYLMKTIDEIDLILDYPKDLEIKDFLEKPVVFD